MSEGADDAFLCGNASRHAQKRAGTSTLAGQIPMAMTRGMRHGSEKGMSLTNLPKSTGCFETSLTVFGLLILGLFSLTACRPVVPVGNITVIERKTSRDGKHDAVWVRVEGNATTDTASWVAIVKAGSASIDLQDAALVAEGSEKVRMWWRGDNLEVHHDFSNGQILHTRSPVRGIDILHLGK